MSRLGSHLLLAILFSACGSMPAAKQEARISDSTVVERILARSGDQNSDTVILKSGERWEDVGQDLKWMGDIHSLVGNHAAIFSGTGCHNCEDGPNILVREVGGEKTFRIPYPGSVKGPQGETDRFRVFFGKCDSKEDLVLAYWIKRFARQNTVRHTLSFRTSGLIEIRKQAKYEEAENFVPGPYCNEIAPLDRAVNP